jgi:hypothetical protein
MNPTVSHLLEQLKQTAPSSASVPVQLDHSLLQSLSAEVVEEARQSYQKTSKTDLDVLRKDAGLKNLLKELEKEQDQKTESLLRQRNALLDKYRQQESVLSLKLKEFDQNIMKEMDRLTEHQQQQLEKAGLPQFRVTRDVKELQRQKWALSILLDAMDA